jgi:light-regulated signal transduction histidine kinase (bacteriophytochrome)
MPEYSNDKKFSSLQTAKDEDHLQAKHNSRTNAEQSVYIEQLKKLNEELMQARRAALNLMEDAILSKDALRRAEEKYRTKLEQEVLERTAELKSTKENLQRSNEDLRQFAHAASHDLKEPVRKIKTFNNRILEDFSDALPDTVKTYLDKIGNATDRMFLMIDGILNYSKMGNIEHLIELVDLNKILYEVINDLELVIQQKSAQITSAGLPEIEGHRVLLYQLFYNLILNSLKFAKANRPSLINIECKIIMQHQEKFYQIEVTDNGIGFEQEYSETIFGTFARLNPADNYEGSGLGLAFCKKIVHRHNGYITATGEQGKGATFTILLPAT